MNKICISLVTVLFPNIQVKLTCFINSRQIKVLTKEKLSWWCAKKITMSISKMNSLKNEVWTFFMMIMIIILDKILLGSFYLQQVMIKEALKICFQSQEMIYQKNINVEWEVHLWKRRKNMVHISMFILIKTTISTNKLKDLNKTINSSRIKG